MTRSRKIRCAIYTRKSSEEGLDQDFNSLDAQREACDAYIASQKHEGWKAIAKRYDDGGKSGGNLERPALQTLLDDIDAGHIDMVVVYKIDRLTRSLPDFAKLVERLETADCSFVSVTQAFNTSSSMGRLTLNVLLSFAQFEREVTAERIRDKISASKKKGLWMGGVAPLGYDGHPDPNRRELVRNDEEATTVRRIFELYDELGCLNAVMHQANSKGLRSKLHRFSTGRTQGGKPFSRGQVYHILRNPTYLGLIRHKDKTYPGQHPAIIEQPLWGRVQESLTKASGRRRGLSGATRNGAPTSSDAPLLGKFRDETGDVLTPTHTQRGSRKHRYYVSNRLISGGADPSAWRLPAASFEKAVTDALVEHFKRAAARLDVITTDDITAAQNAAGASEQLSDRLAEDGPDLTARLIEAGRIEPGGLEIKLSRTALAEALGHEATTLTPGMKSMQTSFSSKRRGAELKLIAGERTPVPDQTLLKALRHAHHWVRLVKSGRPIKHIAAENGKPESYVARILPLALLSPKIQEVIVAGTQPVALTLEQVSRMQLPLDWHAQERMLGLAN